MFAHVACAPDRNLILDAYGWITNQAYQDERGRPIEVIRITEREIREHSGFCWDSAFENLVTKEARKWIELERTIFSGTVPSAIKGYPRTLLAGIPDPGYRLKPICPAS